MVPKTDEGHTHIDWDGTGLVSNYPAVTSGLYPVKGGCLSLRSSPGRPTRLFSCITLEITDRLARQLRCRISTEGDNDESKIHLRRNRSSSNIRDSVYAGKVT